MSYISPVTSKIKYGNVKVGTGINVVNGVISATNGSNQAFGYFYDTTAQAQTAINTATAVSFNSIGDTNNVTDGTGNQFKVLVSGTFSLVFTVSLNKPSGATSVVSLWLRVNGIDVPNSRQDVTMANQTDNLFQSGNYVLTLAANDSCNIMWSVTNTNATLQALPATGAPSPKPAVPSARITVAQI